MSLERKPYKVAISCGVFLFYMGTGFSVTLGAQVRPNNPEVPKLSAPDIEGSLFVDLLERNIKRSPATKAVFKSKKLPLRYQEQEWQHFLEEGNDDLFLAAALYEQFGDNYFSDKLKEHPYHESDFRRGQIVFFLSLPFTILYSYILVSVAKVAFTKGASLGSLDGSETAIMFSLGLVGAGGIVWYDQGRIKKIQSPSRANLQYQHKF